MVTRRLLALAFIATVAALLGHAAAHTPPPSPPAMEVARWQQEGRWGG